jgi:putative hydrolase of the HAD superfamily
MKAILFDLFGTLVPNLPLSTWEQSSAAVASKLQIDTDLYQELWNARFRDRMIGQILDGDHQFDCLLEEAGLEVSIEKRSSAARLHRELLREVLVPKPETCSTLDQIVSAGLQLALVTDCSSAAPELLDETPLGRYFHTRSISAFLGVRKPHPLMYTHCLETLGLAAGECIFVGDGNSEELVGAKKCGLTTVWVDNGQHQHWHERFSPHGDHTIRSLDELLPIIQTLCTE